MSRPRVFILCQYFVPDVSSTGHLLDELSTDLVRRGLDVEVLTAFPSYGPRETWQDCPRRETRAGVKVTRVRSTRLRKDSVLGRILNAASFFFPLVARMLFRRRRRDEVFFYTTNPPFLGAIGAFVSLLRDHPYVVLLHDSYPQIAVRVGKIREGGWIERIWHRVNRLMYRRARRTIVLCDAARDLICETYGVDPGRVHRISNWADGSKLYPIPKAESEFARSQGLDEPFVLLYSGNLGLYYDFDTVLDAAALLRDENFRLVFVGSGGRREWIEEQIRERGLENTVLLPYQPFEELNDSLNACDASLVTIDRGVEGISYPSKLYSSLAVGRPIVALSEPVSQLRRIVEETDTGCWHELGDTEGLARSLREMIRDPARCAEQGRRARELFEERFTLERQAGKYAEVLARASTHREPAAGR